MLNKEKKDLFTFNKDYMTANQLKGCAQALEDCYDSYYFKVEQCGWDPEDREKMAQELGLYILQRLEHWQRRGEIAYY